jgi:uncharacterized protein YktA (UPF0223 family)
MARLKRTKEEFYKSLIIVLDYYDSFMVKENYNKKVAREELLNMFHEYYEWLQGKS